MTNGYVYGEQEPTENCPYCNSICCADFVDIGIGYTQCGPFHCDNCGASEIGPYDKERVLSVDEKRTGWYASGNEPGSSANVIGGKIVSAARMKEEYCNKFAGNPLHDIPGEVEKWFDNIRKKND